MRARGLLCLLAALAVGGCNATHLVYVYDATVGIDVAYSQEGTGRLLFGYERDTFALVPQRCTSEELARQSLSERRSCRGQAMTLSAVSQVRAVGVDEFDFNHFVATGAAAESVADDPVGLMKIRNAIFGDQVEKGDGK